MVTSSSSSSLLTSTVVTTEFIHREIQEAEKALLLNEDGCCSKKTQELIMDGNNNNKGNTNWIRQLHQLVDQTDEIMLAQQIIDWLKQQQKQQQQQKQNSSDINNNSNTCMNVQDEIKHFETLVTILCQHPSNTSSNLYSKLYNEEYLSLYKYMKMKLITLLRKELKRSYYPSSAGCSQLLQELDSTEEDDDGTSFQLILQYCDCLLRLNHSNQQVVRHMTGMSVVLPSEMDDTILELCRPFVERIKYHFIEQLSSSHATPNTSNMTSKRIDRLPEWLFSYIREHVFESGAWDFIVEGLASSPSLSRLYPTLAIDFLNEIVRMIQWVLSERNFFRHPQIAGPHSNPQFLCNAVEQILQFDDYVRGLVSANQTQRVVSLFDVCIAGDEELLQWWLRRERESAFSILFSENVELISVNRILPRAELFCALIRSIQAKAGVFKFSGPYLNSVASPLCVHFIDAIHETAMELKKTMKQRSIPKEIELKRVVNSWVELINGIKMASSVVTTTDNNSNLDSSVQPDQDLARFRRSLENLEDVLIDDFVKTTIDTLLMERAKFAGYIMRCSHFLAISDLNEIDHSNEVSYDLQNTINFLHIILDECCSTTDCNVTSVPEEDASKNQCMDISQYAPKILRARILAEVSTSLLTVALNLDGMTPVIGQAGASVFFRDVKTLFRNFLLPEDGLRLLDIATVMSMETKQLATIGSALCGLSGHPAPLTEDVFESDSRLFEEAVSMIRAKALSHMELSDVLSILNRRNDMK